MNTLDAALHVARAYPGGIEALAHRLGKSPNTLRHELTGDGTAKFGLIDAETMTIFARQAAVRNSLDVLNAFATNVGHMVLPLPTAMNLQDNDCMHRLSDSAREFAELVADVSGAMSDGVVSDNELARIERSAAELLSSLQSLTASIAAMNQQAKLRRVA